LKLEILLKRDFMRRENIFVKCLASSGVQEASSIEEHVSISNTP